MTSLNDRLKDDDRMRIREQICYLQKIMESLINDPNTSSNN